MSSSDLVNRAQEVDTLVAGALFNMGLSVKDVKSKKVYQREKDGVGWEFKDIGINLPQGVAQGEVGLALEKALSEPDIGLKFQRDEIFLISEIQVYGFPTHKLRFSVYGKNLQKRPEKVAKGMKPSYLQERVELKEQEKPLASGFRAKRLKNKSEKIAKKTKPLLEDVVTPQGQIKLPEFSSYIAGLESKSEKTTKETKPLSLENSVKPHAQPTLPKFSSDVKGLEGKFEKTAKWPKPSLEEQLELREQVALHVEKKARRGAEVQTLTVKRPKVVIIVDDLGLNKLLIDKLLEIPAPLTFAVLPHLPYSRYAAEMAYTKGWDVMLHLPMEPKSSSGYTGIDAGDGVLLVGLSETEIVAKLENNLAALPYIKGVNNHMGSRFTENEELMELVLERLKDRGLFFVDSKTSEDTTGFDVAKKLGVKTAERDVFLDQPVEGPNYVRSQIEKLVSLSKRKGYAIGICHPFPTTIEVLSQMIPEIRDEVDIVAVSSVVD